MISLYDSAIGQNPIDDFLADFPQTVDHFIVLSQFSRLAEEAVVVILSGDAGQFRSRSAVDCCGGRLLLRREALSFKGSQSEAESRAYQRFGERSNQGKNEAIEPPVAGQR